MTMELKTYYSKWTILSSGLSIDRDWDVWWAILVRHITDKDMPGA